MCDAPCILGTVLDSVFIQVRVRESCSDGLIYTWRINFLYHTSPPRAPAAELPEGSLSSGLRNFFFNLRVFIKG